MAQIFFRKISFSAGIFGRLENNYFFQEIAPHPIRALNVAGQIGLDYWKINSISPQKPKGKLSIKWKPPPSDWIKLNFDGSVCDNMAAIECLALHDGLAHAISEGWRKVFS
ncbi:PREDICTED: PRUPE_1G162400 partial [Prunus dulcis]|uniref:PREDICTED: PRUPE_1G162400 partial n=1 Tax=Prunus dulcis TaxID=3755 RepID=A0A5E4GHW9_PRUDU|nr:PREDICTED: PRUPE_1G162400 partial [Prunus dulcis]